MSRFSIALSAILIPALLVSQAYIRQRYEDFGLPLSFSTQVGLGWAPPLVLVGLLIATIIVSRSASPRFRNNWEIIVVIVCGTIVGHQFFALFFAYPWGLQVLGVSVPGLLTT